MTKANAEIKTLKRKESRALSKRKTLFRALKRSQNDFTKIKGKCPSTKSVTTARDTKKKASEQIVAINKKIQEAKTERSKTADKTKSANYTLTIKNLRRERKIQTKVIRTSSRTIYRWRSGSLRYRRGSRWRKWRRGGRSRWTRKWKYGKGRSYRSGGCRSCQRVYDNYIKKCMGSAKGDSKWKTCDAKYHQKLFGTTKLTQVEGQQKPETSPMSPVTLNKGIPPVADTFNKTSNTTSLAATFEPAFYETKLPM